MTMSVSSLLLLTLLSLTLAVDAFVPLLSSTSSTTAAGRRTTTSTSTTSLFAVSALVRKAKEAELRKQIKDNGGIEDAVMEKYKLIQTALKAEESDDADDDATTTAISSKSKNIGMGILQSNLTRRKGTITVIAEYKRKIADGLKTRVPSPKKLN